MNKAAKKITGEKHNISSRPNLWTHWPAGGRRVMYGEGKIIWDFSTG